MSAHTALPGLRYASRTISLAGRMQIVSASQVEAHESQPYGREVAVQQDRSSVAEIVGEAVRTSSGGAGLDIRQMSQKDPCLLGHPVLDNHRGKRLSLFELNRCFARESAASEATFYWHHLLFPRPPMGRLHDCKDIGMAQSIFFRRFRHGCHTLTVVIGQWQG